MVGSGDFNGDGRADILWYNTATGQVWIWFIDIGGTTIQSSLQVGIVGNLNWTIVGIGDYDCDGDADIIWRESAGGFYQMYLMNGNIIETNVRFISDSNLFWAPVFVD